MARSSAQARTRPRAISPSFFSELLMRAGAEAPSTDGEGAHAAWSWGRSSQRLSVLWVPARSPGPEADAHHLTSPSGDRSQVPWTATPLCFPEALLKCRDVSGRAGSQRQPSPPPAARRLSPKSLPLKTGVLSQRRFPMHGGSRLRPQDGRQLPQTGVLTMAPGTVTRRHQVVCAVGLEDVNRRETSRIKGVKGAGSFHTQAVLAQAEGCGVGGEKGSGSWWLLLVTQMCWLGLV